VREEPASDDDRPPTPPPKDDKPFFKGLKKTPEANGAAKKGSANGVKSSHAAAAAPVIGELGFEKKEDEKRPPLETFVTASEGGELKSS
jgi:hypothetical protein